LPLARPLKHLLERGLSVLRTPCTTSRNLSTSDDAATTTADLHEARRNSRRGGRQAGERHIAGAAACPSRLRVFDRRYNLGALLKAAFLG
jgi:hypothetical protein